MGRAAPPEDRMPSKRKSKEERAAEAEEAEIKNDAEYWKSHYLVANQRRNAADWRVAELEAENELLKKALLEKNPEAVVSADAVRTLASRKVYMRELKESLAPSPEEEEQRKAQRSVRLHLRGKPDAVRTDADPPPPGCRIYRGAVRTSLIEACLPPLEQQLQEDERVGAISAGQTDGKRLQLTLPAEDDLSLALLTSLRLHGELAGRIPSDINFIQSLAGCKAQKLHWDFDPDVVRGLKRKPCSVILALESGAMLHVFHEGLGKKVPVPLSPGDVLVFDGDVKHHGSGYASKNTRAHLYLDVDRVVRKPNYTWGLEK